MLETRDARSTSLEDLDFDFDELIVVAEIARPSGWDANTSGIEQMFRSMRSKVSSTSGASKCFIDELVLSKDISRNRSPYRR